MPKKLDPLLEPGHEDFNPLAVAKHLTTRIESFTSPFGLQCYWNAKKNQARLKLLPEKWREELWRRFQHNIDVLNNAGPHD